MAYYSIHTHSFYSIGDSILKPNEAADWLVSKDIKKIAFTDHGNCCGVFEIRNILKKKGIKHYPGLEYYFCDNRKLKDKDNRKSEHLLGIAKTYEGVLNLFKLSSLSYTEGFYYKPRIDYELLEKYGKGIIFSSACLKGPISRKLLENKYDEALNITKRFKDMFGENFLIEIMPHDLDEQRICNKGLIEIANKLNIKLVASNDAHYLTSEDHDYRDILIMANQKTTINQKDRMETECRTLYLMDSEMIRNAFKIYHPYIEEKIVSEAIENTAFVLDGEPPEMTDNVLHFPTYKLDENTAKVEGITEEERKDYNDNNKQKDLLYRLAYDGLKKKGFADKKEYVDRLEYEFGIISKMGFVDYFLMVRDIVKHCQQVGISVGPGRGTACSSILGHCLGITKLDPVKYGLIFERFLNPHRCLDPFVKILTKEGIKNLKDIKIGEYVYSENGFQKVVDKIESKHEEYLEIEISDQKIICSLNHKWPVIRNKRRILIEAKDIIEGDEILMYENKS